MKFLRKLGLKHTVLLFVFFDEQQQQYRGSVGF